jgi:hypothetical protein
MVYGNIIISVMDFCNFYGQQYGFEIEFPIVTGQAVMTTRSVSMH